MLIISCLDINWNILFKVVITNCLYIKWNLAVQGSDNYQNLFLFQFICKDLVQNHKTVSDGHVETWQKRFYKNDDFANFSVVIRIKDSETPNSSVLSRKNKKDYKIQRDLKKWFLFNIIVSGIYILFMKIQLNPFQDTLINYSCRSSMNKF